MAAESEMDLVDIESFLDEYLVELRERSLSDKERSMNLDAASGAAAPGDVGLEFPPIPPSLAALGASFKDSFKELLPRLDEPGQAELEADRGAGVTRTAPAPELAPATNTPSLDQEHSSNSGDMRRVHGSETDDKADDKLKVKRAKALQEKNRRAQRRFRERQKARVAELEAQVAMLNQRIAGLMAEKADLESRNSFLEKVVALRDEKIDGMRALGKTPSSAGRNDDDAAAVSVAFTEQLTLTVDEGREVTLTVEDVKKLGHADLARYWKEYVQQLSTCLVEAGAEPDGPAARKVDRLTQEACMLVMRVALLNPTAVKLFGLKQMEDTQASPHIANYEMWQAILRSMDLSKQQKREMVQLRRLFLLKLQKIVEARRDVNLVLATALPTCGRDAAIDFLKAHQGINRLKANLRDEHILVLDFVSTLLKHVFTNYQVARCIVQAYPWSPDCLAMTTWAAAEAGEQDAIAAINMGSSFGRATGQDNAQAAMAAQANLQQAAAAHQAAALQAQRAGSGGISPALSGQSLPLVSAGSMAGPLGGVQMTTPFEMGMASSSVGPFYGGIQGGVPMAGPGMMGAPGTAMFLPTTAYTQQVSHQLQGYAAYQQQQQAAATGHLPQGYYGGAAPQVGVAGQPQPQLDLASMLSSQPGTGPTITTGLSR